MEKLDFNVIGYRGVENENSGYVVLDLELIQGDAKANPFANGRINVSACVSRKLTYRKTIFPATVEQRMSLKKALFDTYGGKQADDYDKDNNYLHFVLSGDKDKNFPKILCTIVTVETEAYYIVNSTTQSGFYESEPNKPKLFNNVQLLLMIDDDGNSVEGEPETLAKLQYSRSIANGTYITKQMYDSLQQNKPKVEQKSVLDAPNLVM